MIAKSLNVSVEDLLGNENNSISAQPATLARGSPAPYGAGAADARLAAVLVEMDTEHLRGTLAAAIDHNNATAIEVCAGELAARARRDQVTEGKTP